MATTPATICLLLLLAGVAISRAERKTTCYAKDDNPYLHFGTKTAYEFIKQKSGAMPSVRDCEPLQVWMMVRHGTRNPSRSEIGEMKMLSEMRNQIVRNHEDRRDGRLCDEDLKNLKKWNLDVSVSQADDLTNQGQQDMEFLARTLRTRFSSLLNQNYSPEHYLFRYTDTERTRSSAQAFASSLFSGRDSHIYLPEPVHRDSLLESYRNCSYWEEKVRDNPETYLEQELFINGSHVQSVVQSVSNRLGFRYKLAFKQIYDMYQMCRYDKAWLINAVSPWCAVFTQDDLEVLEYVEDLKYYYKHGYGNQVNARLGCPPVVDLIKRFTALENSTRSMENIRQPWGVFYFTHSTAIQQTLASLGIAKDIPKLLHSNYGTLKHREWKTSLIGPFASNIAAVFFRCSHGERNKVMFYLQERMVDYEGCNVGLCSWEFIKEKFAKPVAECDLNRICKDGANASEATRATLWVVSSLAAIIAVVNHVKC